MNIYYSNFFLIPIGVGSTFVILLDRLMFDEYYQSAYLILMFISLIYFFIDLVLMIIEFNNNNLIFYVHHILSIFSIIISLNKYNQIIKYVVAYLTFELSTPFLNISKLKCKNNIFFEVMFVIFFIVTRIIFGTYLTYEVCVSILKINNFVVNFLIMVPIILQLMQYYWFRMIFKRINKKIVNI